MQQLLSRDKVVLALTYIATSLGRKVDQRRLDIYHRELSRTLTDEQFEKACSAVLDEDEKFPSIARLKDLGKGHRAVERGQAHIRDCGPLADCLSTLDQGMAYGGDDQFRGRRHTKPAVERLVYEDAAVTVKALPGETLTERLGRIARQAEIVIERMETSAVMLTPQPPSPQAEL